MLKDAQCVRIVADSLSGLRGVPVIVDPVMVPSSGKRLLGKSGVRALIDGLLPICALVTPNMDEAEVICGFGVSSINDTERAAVKIHGMGAGAVLVKGGHMDGDPVDVFYDGNDMAVLRGRRIPGGPYHGTGCVLSSAIAAYMAKGVGALPAIKKARLFLTCLMKRAERVGSGAVPLV
jgi:hydroxymethylpyrimidine/phosphomethylpyrimidine kinase